MNAFCLLGFADEAVDAIAVRVKGIGAELEMAKKENHEADGEANGKAEYVNKGICLVPDDIAPGQFQVVFQHSGSFAVMGVITSR
jgi:hypothetical protein